MRYLLLTALLGIMYPYDSNSCESSFSFFSHRFIFQRFNTLFSYPAGTHKAGSELELSPTIVVKGGTFSYTRITKGPGMITFDSNTGKISLRSSDPGIYDILYKVNDQSETVRIEIN